MDWKNQGAPGLEAAISIFKQSLPGWWFRVGECQVSCDASCAPTRESDHINLIPPDTLEHDFFVSFSIEEAEHVFANVKAQGGIQIATYRTTERVEDLSDDQ